MAPAELLEFTLNSPLPLQTFLFVLLMSVHDTTHKNPGALLGSSLSLSNHVHLNKNFYQFCSITLSLTYHFFFILAVYCCGPILLTRSLRQLINPPPTSSPVSLQSFCSPQRRQNDSFMMQIGSFYSFTKSFNGFYL